MAIAKAACKCTKCGREFVSEKKCFNRTEANDYETWAEINITTCPVCYGAMMRAKEAASNKAFDEEWTLPDLSGSDKQIAWAIDIRIDALKYLVSEFVLNLDKPGKYGVSRSDILEYMVSDITRAKDWIDFHTQNGNRRELFAKYCEKYMKSHDL